MVKQDILTNHIIKTDRRNSFSFLNKNLTSSTKIFLMNLKTLQMTFLILFPLVSLGQQKLLQNDPNTSIDVYFKYKTTKMLNNEKQLDSIYVLIDSLIRKYKMVVVIPWSKSEEIKKDPLIDYKRAEKIIKYYTERYDLGGLIFLIQPPLRPKYANDLNPDKLGSVHFMPLKLQHSGEE